MSTDPKFLWLGEKHKEALATLKYGIFENKGVLALTGDVGTGKTTLINALVKDLGKDIIVATIYDPGLEPLEFFNIVAVAFNMGVTFKNKGQFLIHFRQFLQKARKQNQKVLLIIDEAQRIGPELLEETRLLSNLEAEHIRLLNIFFVGQNEFVGILQEDVNRALRQRVAISYDINPLTIEETAAYIIHRLRIAGAKTPIFTKGVVQEIFDFSSGYPRLINIICDHALLSGFVKGVQSINQDVIRECKKELQVSEWVPGHDKDIEKENVKEAQRQDHLSEQNEDQDEEQDTVRLARGLYQKAPATRPDKRPVGLAILSVVLLFLITGVVGYVYYNRGKIKIRIPGTISLKKDSVSDVKPSDSKEDRTYIVPFIPKSKEKEPSQTTGSVATSSESEIKAADESSFKEPTSEDAAKPVVALVERGADGSEMSTPEGKEETIDAAKQREQDIQDEKNKDREKYPSSLEPIKPVIIPIPIKASDNVKKTTPKAVKSSTSSKISTAEKRDVLPSKKKETKPPVTPKDEGSKKKILSKEQTLTTHVDQKVDLKAPPYKRYETINEQKIVKENLEPRLKAFLGNYCRAYENKKLDQFTVFFAPDAIEDAKPFAQQLPKYRRNFERIDALNYGIKLNNYSIQKETGLISIEGTYYAKAQLAGGSGEWKQSSGGITMTLEAYRDTFRIKRLGSMDQSSRKATTASDDDLLVRLNAFLKKFSKAYENKQLDEYATFFTPDAMEKGEPFHSQLPKYRRNFKKIDSMDYRIDLKRYSVQEASGLIRIEGIANLRAKLMNDTGGWRENSMGISMVLKDYGDSFRVRRLDY